MHENEVERPMFEIRVPPWYSSSKALLRAIGLRTPHRNKWGDWSTLERKNRKARSRCFVSVNDDSSGTLELAWIARSNSDCWETILPMQ